MLISSVLKSPINSVLQNVFDINTRFVYNFDGVDDYAVLPYRAINPDGDLTLEFWSPNINAAALTIVAQNISGTASSREFELYTSSNATSLIVNWGGSLTAIMFNNQGYEPNKKYFVSFVGTTCKIAKDTPSNVIRTTTFTRGTAREPAAQTLIGCRGNGTGLFAGFFQGIQRDIRINGVLWPIADRNQVIQLPSPAGLGAELITPTILENPAVKGSQWTYLGAGRWQYVGDGTLNELVFLNAPAQPVAGFLEFEVESISGQMTCAISSTGNDSNPVFTSVGVQRYFFTKPGNTGSATQGNRLTFKRLFGAASCIIKNISFKPLYTTNPAELVTNGDFSAGTGGWISAAGGSTSVSSGQATLTTVAGQPSRLERNVTLEPNVYYEMSCDIISFTGNLSARLAIIRGAAGGFATVISSSTTTAGKIRAVFLAPATDGIVQIHGDAVNVGNVVVDNVSIRKLDSICNQMTLVNTSTDRWQERIP